MDITIHADSSARIGAGHVVRMLSFALHARNMGHSVQMIGRFALPWTLERIKRENIPYTELGGDIPSHEHPERFADTGGWTVLDGYHFGPDCHNMVNGRGGKLTVVDDYAHLAEYNCHILLNQNPGADRLTYNGNTSKKCMGLEYALLHPVFAEKHIKASLPQQPRKILLTLGGGDNTEHFGRIAPFFRVPEITGRTLTVVSGATPHRTISEIFKGCGAKVVILDHVDDMASLLADTHLCVTAGGSTCWELCCMGVPFLTVETAENQRHGIEAMSDKYGIKPLAAASLSSALRNTTQVGEIVDGRGAIRLVGAMSSYE